MSTTPANPLVGFTIQQDGSGNPYVQVQNVRITLARKEAGSPKDWSPGTLAYLRFSGLDGNGCPMPGPEYPIHVPQEGTDLLAALALLLTHRMAW
jgi:hypothetical protein